MERIDMQRTGLIAASLLALMTLTARADTSTVFGIELRKPFTVPECSFTRIKSAGYYGPATNGPCYELIIGDDNKGKKLPVSTDRVMVTWPLGSMPKPMTGIYAIASIIDGTLEGISFNTLGIQSQERDLQMLTEKYGKPGSIDQPTMQNGYGAKFVAIRAQWNVDDIVVAFESAGGSSNSGIVHIDTLKGAADRKATLDKLAHSGPSL
jgi:hypothetical protein